MFFWIFFFFSLTDVWVVKIPHEHGLLWSSQPKCYPRNSPFLLSSSPGGLLAMHITRVLFHSIWISHPHLLFSIISIYCAPQRYLTAFYSTFLPRTHLILLLSIRIIRKDTSKTICKILMFQIKYFRHLNFCSYVCFYTHAAWSRELWLLYRWFKEKSNLASIIQIRVPRRNIY